MIEQPASRKSWPDCLNRPSTTYISMPFHPLELPAILKRFKPNRAKSR